MVSDRYVDSMLAYQGAGRVLALEEVEQVARWATEDLRPHLTVVLDTEPAEAVHAKADLDRLEGRAVFHGNGPAVLPRARGREPEHYLVLNARASGRDRRRVVERVGRLLRPWSKASGGRG